MSPQEDITANKQKDIVSYRYNYKYNQCLKFMAIFTIKDVTKRNERKIIEK